MNDEFELPDHLELGRCKNGVDYDLEEYADELLAEYRRKRPRREDDDPYEVLSPGQIDRRHSREIYNKNGVPEVELYSGIYRRADNPLMRDRPRSVKDMPETDTPGEYVSRSQGWRV